MTTDGGEFNAIEETLWKTQKDDVETMSSICCGSQLISYPLCNQSAQEIVQAHNLAVQDLQDEVSTLMQWVGDLQTGLYVNCIYCGHRYPPETPDVRDQALYNHIKECQHHPLSKALAQIEELRNGLIEVYLFLTENQWREIDPDPYPSYLFCDYCHSREMRGHAQDCSMRLRLERLKELIDEGN